VISKLIILPLVTNLTCYDRADIAVKKCKPDDVKCRIQVVLDLKKCVMDGKTKSSK
jgi:hypothetical protein